MSTYKFKTTINCGGCVFRVSPFLNEGNKIEHWEVDVSNSEKLLTVRTSLPSLEKVIKKVRKCDLEIEKI